MACHFPAAIIFSATILYVILALRIESLLPNPKARKPLKYIVPIILLGAIISALIIVLPLFGLWIENSSLTPYGNSWALIPLLVLNNLTIPFFLSVFLGLLILYTKKLLPEFTLAALVVVISLLALSVLGVFMNMTPKYIYSMMPIYYICAGVLCQTFYENLKTRNIIIALSPCILLVSADLPSVASYFLERSNISDTKIIQYIVKHAEPNDLLVCNINTKTVDTSKLFVTKIGRSLQDNTFNWGEYLKEYEQKDRNVWFALSVRRGDFAPGLKKWLTQYTEWRYEQKAHRIDRRAKTISIWLRKYLYVENSSLNKQSITE